MIQTQTDFVRILKNIRMRSALKALTLGNLLMGHQWKFLNAKSFLLYKNSDSKSTEKDGLIKLNNQITYEGTKL